jgi:undecaprenyl-diphosphatase
MAPPARGQRDLSPTSAERPSSLDLLTQLRFGATGVPPAVAPFRNCHQRNVSSADRITLGRAGPSQIIRNHLPMKPVLTILGLLAIFGAITGAVISGVGNGADRSAVLAFRIIDNPSRLVGPEWLPETARNLTSIGSVTLLTVVVAVAAGCLALSNKTDAARRILIAFIGGLFLLNVLKWGIARSRPDFVLPLGDVFTSSFPSGHAALSATTYFTLAVIVMRLTTERRLRIFIALVGLALTFVAGLSRVYLGLHYPSDVLAGWCLGLAWALCCNLIMDRYLSNNSSTTVYFKNFERQV